MNEENKEQNQEKEVIKISNNAEETKTEETKATEVKSQLLNNEVKPQEAKTELPKKEPVKPQAPKFDAVKPQTANVVEPLKPQTPKFEEVKPQPKKNQEKPQFEEVARKKNVVRTDSYFDGGLLELIGWRLLAFIIICVTLGIATPWAKCMLYNYQFKHTVYNGKRLKFEGTGGDLFVNIFKWVFLSIITLGIYAIFVPVKKAKWVVSNLHFEDEDYISGDSYFDGNTLQLIGVNLLTIILTVFSFGLLAPFALCFKLRWINKHSVINRKRLVFAGSALSLWGYYILWSLLTIVTFGIFGLWLPIVELKWQTKNIHIRTVGEVEKKDKTLWIAIPIIILVMILGGFAISKIVESIDFSDIDEDSITEFLENTGIRGYKVKKNNDYSTSVKKNDVNKEVVVQDNNNTKTEPDVDYSSERKPYQPAMGATEEIDTGEVVGAPAIKEIPGTYVVDVKDTDYKVIESGVKITFTSDGTKLKYNDEIVMNYDPYSGYAWYENDYSQNNDIYEAYFSALSNGKIRVELRRDSESHGGINSLDGYKQ